MVIARQLRFLVFAEWTGFWCHRKLKAKKSCGQNLTSQALQVQGAELVTGLANLW